MSFLRHNLDSFAHAFKSLGISHVVVSPGSRNAPIVAGFLRIGGFNMLSAPDERAAAFMALGAAQATGKPALVMCTSGTAALNLYPGICEAFYQRVPLIAITADRPENLIDQWDGQTIRQKDIFEKHILKGFHAASDLHEKAAETELLALATESVSISMGKPRGPVHINIPLSEPIYEGLETPVSKNWAKPAPVKAESQLEPNIPAALQHTPRILFLAGQLPPDEILKHTLQTISKTYPVVADVLSNIQGESIINGTENLAAIAEQFKPDALITLGLSVVSKSLKLQLRKLNIPLHFHLGDGGFTGDPFFTNPKTLNIPANTFLTHWLKCINHPMDSAFYRAWQNAVSETKKSDTEAELIQKLILQIPKNACLQLGNSMIVRHANRCKTLPDFVFGNRGTSGIDGSVSTAVGYAWARPDQQVYCLSGDIAFLYDKNAWWCNPLPANIRVVVINNGGGMIFDRLQGPEKMPELRHYMHTPHHYTAQSIAEHYNIPYSSCKAEEIKNLIEIPSGILEIFTA